jgi:hypothetical protein
MGDIGRKMLVPYFFLIASNLFSQIKQVSPQITGLNEFDLPIISSREWFQLNYSSRNKYYIDNNGNVIIKQEEGTYQYTLEYDNGRFVGTNHGEWGGELVFQSNNIEYIILQENICGIVNYNNEIYILTGLSHLGISKGKIIRLEKNNAKWESKCIWEFDSSPEIYAIFDSTIYIVTFDGLIAFDGNIIQQILKGQFWRSLYPQSIFINRNIIAIGLRGCIALINKEDYEVKSYR